MSTYLSLFPALTILAMLSAPSPHERVEPLSHLSRLTQLREMVSLKLETGIERVTYDPDAGVVMVPREALSRELLEVVLDTPAVGFLIWSDKSRVFIGLSASSATAYRWQRDRLVLGTPRELPSSYHPRRYWLGEFACDEELPEFPLPDLERAWDHTCFPELRDDNEPPIDMALLSLSLKGSEHRAWFELMKASRGDKDALDAYTLDRFHDLSATYRRHAALHHAISYANDEDLISALEHLDRARQLGTRYDVKRGEATEARIQQLGRGWLTRVLMALLQRGEDRRALDLHDRYPYWSALQPAWIQRLLAQSMRREHRTQEAIDLYLHTLPEVTPEFALLGELATTYLEANDAYRARAIQKWVEENQGEQENRSFTTLIQWLEAGSSCLPDRPWSQQCIELHKPSRGDYLDLLLEDGPFVAWGQLVPSHGMVQLAMGEEIKQLR